MDSNISLDGTVQTWHHFEYLCTWVWPSSMHFARSSISCQHFTFVDTDCNTVALRHTDQDMPKWMADQSWHVCITCLNECNYTSWNQLTVTKRNQPCWVLVSSNCSNSLEYSKHTLIMNHADICHTINIYRFFACPWLKLSVASTELWSFC